MWISQWSLLEERLNRIEHDVKQFSFDTHLWLKISVNFSVLSKRNIHFFFHCDFRRRSEFKLPQCKEKKKTPIDSLSECTSIIKLFYGKYQFKGETNNASNPKGCYLFELGDRREGYYNNVISGRGSANSKALCNQSKNIIVSDIFLANFYLHITLSIKQIWFQYPYRWWILGRMGPMESL